MSKNPTFDNLKNIDGKGLFWDSNEFTDLNSTLIITVKTLRAVSEEITKYERKRSEIALEYKQSIRRFLVESKAKTETQKKQLAEIEYEDLEADLENVEVILKELHRIAGNLKVELDILKTVGHNLRQEARIL